MQATVQIRSGHVMPTDDDRLPSGDPHGPPDAVLPVLKSSSLLEGHHYDWGDNRRVLDRSMLAYSNHARQLTEHDSSSPVGRQWMMLPRMNRAHADAANESSLRASSDMTLMCADREVPVLSPFRTVSELPGNAANIMRHSPYHSKPKRYNSGLRDQPAVTQNDQGLATCGQQEVREPEVTSISIVPFPPPAVDTQIVISDSKISDGVKKSEKNKNAVKRAQFFKKGVLPPITKSKAKHKTDSAAEDGTTSPTRHLRMRKGKSTLVQGSCAPIHAKDNSHDIDEVLHANVNGNAESEPDQTNELWEKAARATGISNFQGRERGGGGGGGGGSKTDSKPKQRKGFTPRVMKGTMNKKSSTPKKDDVIKDEEDADPQIKSVLKKKGNTYEEKSVKFGEELEFVRIVTKIEYPWYNESSSDDGEKDEEDTESSSDSSSSSSSSSSEDEEEKKKVKRKVRKKIPKKKCVKTNTSKSIIVDEMQGISSKSSPGRSCKSIESLSEGKKRASGLTKSDIEPGCYEPTNCQDTPPASVACKLRDDEVVPDCDEVVPADIDHSALSKNGHIAESSCEVVCETSDDLLVSTAVSTTADEIGSAEETPGTDINSLKCAEQNA